MRLTSRLLIARSPLLDAVLRRSRWGALATTVALLSAVALSVAAGGYGGYGGYSGDSALHAAAGDDWPSYAFSAVRSGDNRADAINASNAAGLKLHWTHTAGGSVSSQPAVGQSLGLVYWGSWDGYEHATSLATNTTTWARFLGVTNDTNCNPPKVGVASSATLGAINGTPAIFVGGGADVLYALNAATGSVIWRTSLGSTPGSFLWSSPAVANGSVYIGNSSFGDCPLTQGKLFQLNVSTGAIQHVFNVVPNGCTGGGVWGSPSVDTAAGFVYFATGNPGSCSSPYTEAVIKVSAANVSTIVDFWQARGPDKADLDFGSTPTLFPATINGGVHQLLGIGNKDGVYYALNRNNLKAGPSWRAKIAQSGDCPQCGSGSISPSAWDGVSLYVAGGVTSIGGVSCAGSLSALNPSTGTFNWRHCLQNGPVLGAVSVSGAPGVIFVGQGNYLMGIRAANGATIFRYHDATNGSAFWGSAAISGGIVYIGNMDGRLDAFGL